MECPGCHAEIDDGSVVCPHCETVVDPSLLNAMPPDHSDSDTGSQAPLPPRKTGSKPKVKKVARKSSPGAVPVRKTGVKSAPRAATGTPPRPKKKDWRDDVSEEDWGNSRNPPPAEAPREQSLDADDYLGHLKQFVVYLSLADKIAFFGALATFVACFFPWKETVKDGEILGVGSAGVLVTLSAVAAIVFIVMRSQPDSKVNRTMLWAGQLGAGAFSVLWCLVCVQLSWDSTLARAQIGNQQIWTSKPTFGVFLAILTGGITTMGTLFGLKESQNR